MKSRWRADALCKQTIQLDSGQIKSNHFLHFIGRRLVSEWWPTMRSRFVMRSKAWRHLKAARRCQTQSEENVNNIDACRSTGFLPLSPSSFLSSSSYFSLLSSSQPSSFQQSSSQQSFSIVFPTQSNRVSKEPLLNVDLLMVSDHVNCTSSNWTKQLNKAKVLPTKCSKRTPAGSTHGAIQRAESPGRVSLG